MGVTHTNVRCASLVSAIRYPLAESSKSKVITEETEFSDIKVLENTTKRIALAICYDSLSEFWAECLWNGWSVSERDDINLIFPPQSKEFLSRILSQHRVDTLLFELTWRSITLWKNMPDELRNLEVSRPRIIKIKRHKKKVEFILGRQTNQEDASATFLAAIAAEELYWNELLCEPLPKASGLNIREMLSIWYVLASLGEVLKSNFPKDTGVPNPKKLLEFSPVMQLPTLKYAIRKATGLHYKKIEAAINLFLFSGTTRHDPWFKPIVPLSNNECTVIVPALTVPNLIRSIESWMKEGGLVLSDRGVAFEDYIRTTLKESIDRSKLLSKTKASTRSLEVSDGHISEQIDLMWLVGSVLIVGEVKCAIYPASPIEHHNYIETLRGAAEQADRKAQFVGSNIKNSLSLLGIENRDDFDKITVFPLVITNLHLGVGGTVDNVPISDIYILELYLKGSQKFFVETSADGEGEAIHTEIFYSSEQEAEANLTSYLSNPPSFRILAKLVDSEIIQLPPLKEDEKKKAYVRVYVKEPNIEN
jgi:hypothetical protein